MKIKKITEIDYSNKIYTPQVQDNENYLFDNGCLSKNCQNMSAKTLQLCLSRIDKTCKAIIIGSNKQIDNMYTNKYINGLSVLLNACNYEHDEVKLWAGELNKVLRGPITEFAEKIFSK